MYLELVKTLPILSTSQRLKIALGGFISIIGLIILLSVILSITGTIDFKSVFQNEIMVGAVLFIGFLDVFCGFFLVFREKKIN